uniref:Uncharacterized protein n=1 Tax=Astyanax mexicanus TaxID=7994 RepID=A0A8B9KUS8_ASTMX
MSCGCPIWTPCWQRAGTAVARFISEVFNTATVATFPSTVDSVVRMSFTCSASCCAWARVWVLRWFLRLETVLKAFPHSAQECGLSPVCVRLCSGLSPECVRKCSRRCVFCRKRFPQTARWHTSQWYGRTPVCVRPCLLRLASEENVLPQTLHWKGRSPVCVRRWFRRWICFLNGFPQTLHLKRRSLEWAVCRWLSNRICEVNALPQVEQENPKASPVTRVCTVSAPPTHPSVLVEVWPLGTSEGTCNVATTCVAGYSESTPFSATTAT